MSGHLDGPPPGPPDPPYIPGDLGAPSAEEFARRRASSEPRPENPYPPNEFGKLDAEGYAWHLGSASRQPEIDALKAAGDALAEAQREQSAAWLTVAPVLEAHWYEANASGHAWNAWTRWGERALARGEAALAAWRRTGEGER